MCVCGRAAGQIARRTHTQAETARATKLEKIVDELKVAAALGAPALACVFFCSRVPWVRGS